MNTYEIIKKKRDGLELNPAEIEFMIGGYVDGQIADYQMAAFLMAIYFKGMTNRECLDLTMQMTASGDQIDLSEIKGFKVDKHSTGGVGDTTSLVLGPLVAACGGIVAKMTGRELGHTGGTVDKLEAIPGMQMALSKDRFVQIANSVRLSLTAQSARLAPADKHIYALRNVTATVDSIPLIASSIMSKKLAAGTDGIVLDVKTGSGAFMQTYEDAVALAQMMVAIGRGAGKNVIALITSMDQPLGFAIGNAIEVKEAIDTLNGSGPPDLVELVAELGSHMLVMGSVAATLNAARGRLQRAIDDKSGLGKLAEFIAAQSGDPGVADNPGLLPQPAKIIEVPSPRSGWVKTIDALAVGMASKILGAGRNRKEDVLDHSIGIELRKKVGDRVNQGEPLALFHSDGDRVKLEAAQRRFVSAYTIGNERINPPRLVLARVTEAGVEKLDQ